MKAKTTTSPTLTTTTTAKLTTHFFQLDVSGESKLTGSVDSLTLQIKHIQNTFKPKLVVSFSLHKVFKYANVCSC